MVTGEQELRELIDTVESARLLEKFSTLIRESGSQGERDAATYISSRLQALGIPFEVHEPELFVSVPREASLAITANGDTVSFKAKTPSFSRSTNGETLSGELVHVPSVAAQDLADLFVDGSSAVDEASLRGKIVVTEGLSMPAVVRRFEQAGAIGQIYINPGERIHECVCTTIWGTPTLRNSHRLPTTPIVCINREDGDRVVALCGAKAIAHMDTRLEEGWFRCPLPVATIRGTDAPDQYLLVHGHYDSWHYGIGDNATGNAALLELARVFHQGRSHLKRSIKIAWWPGHSQGRYAGSTWFADEFALDLRKNAIGQANIDSPGCRKATSYEEIMWMAECSEFGREAVADCTGQHVVGHRPVRAGDYSFNQIGLSSFFMLLSNRPPEERKKLGLYTVGGCGGDLSWHTEADTMEVADLEVLRKDIEIYVTAFARVVNASVLPYDHRATASEIGRTLRDYAEEAANAVNFDSALQESDQLEGALEEFYRILDENDLDEVQTASANRLLLELGRRLIPLNYVGKERFEHDPAEGAPPIPKLAGVKRLNRLPADSNEFKFLATELKRHQNQIANALHEATELVRLYLGLQSLVSAEFSRTS